MLFRSNGKLGAIVAFNKPIDEELAKGIAIQVVTMNPVSVSAEDCPAEVVEKERQVAIEKTKEEQVRKAVENALKKAGINPAHCDSEDHIQSNTAKGWLTPEQADQARAIRCARYRAGTWRSPSPGSLHRPGSLPERGRPRRTLR